MARPRVPVAKMDQERRNALLLYGAIGAVVLFALGLISWGYYKDRIAPSHETVLTVGSRKFDLGFLERRVAADLKLNTTNPARNLQDLVVRSLQSIELEEVTRQAGRDAGIKLTEAELDKEITLRLGLPSDASREVFASLYRREILRVGLPVGEYREIVAAQVIETRMRDQLREGIPAEGEQVDAQILRTENETKLKEAQAKLAGGDKFNVVALTYSNDPSKETGGEIGWVVPGELRPKVSAALFSLAVEKVSEPIQETDGWYLVVAKAKEVRPTDGGQRQRVAARRFDDAVQDVRVKVGSKSSLSDLHILRVGQKVLG